MAVGDLNIALVLELVDRASKPARAAEQALQKIAHVTEMTGRAGVEWSNQQIAATQARRSALQGEAFGIAATGFALINALKPAIEFESAMAGVSKVVDFDRPQGLAEMEASILALTTSGALPMAADGIAAIIEAAGQAGVVDAALPDDEERQALLDFARDAAKMGVAFDISAEQSGEAMAQWRTAMGLTQEQALNLGNAINHISNNMNAKAPEMVDIIRRQGAVAQASGLSEVETAAMSGALLSGGASPEVAATGLKNFLGALTKGDAVTKRQAQILSALGFDPTTLSKRMQEDAQSAIIDVVEAMADLPIHEQSSAIGQLFGEESKGAVAPLLTNVELLRKAFNLVGDPTEYAGSMLAEYAKQAETTANALKLTRNYVTGLAIAAGSILLPELNALMATLQPIVTSITQWAQANPELITLLFRLTAGTLAFKMASIALRWGLFSLILPILNVTRASAGLLLMSGRLGKGLLALLNPMKLVRGGLYALRLAFIATGIGALLAGIAMAGVWIYNNWSGLGAFFQGFWAAFAASLGPAAPLLGAIIDQAKTLWHWFTDLLGPVQASGDTWTAWGVNAGTALGEVIGNVTAWTGANSGLITTIASLYGGWLALRLVWALPMAPLRAAGRLLAWIGTGPLMALLKGVKLLGGAFLRLGLLALANPIGLLIASVGALALVVYQNWDKITAYLGEKIETVRAAFDVGILNGVFTALSEFNPFVLAADGLKGLLKYIAELTGIPESIVAAFGSFSLYDPGIALMQSLWDGMASLLPQLVASIKAKLASLKPQWITDLQNWVGGGGTDDTPPARDNGGPVRAGMPYLVGERAPEIFVPGVSGAILPTRILRAAMAATALAAPVAAQGDDTAAALPAIDQRPALSAPNAAPTVVNEGHQIALNIYAAPGMSPEDIAAAVRRELSDIEDERRGDLHDGANT